jgi:hypothetical protein
VRRQHKRREKKKRRPQIPGIQKITQIRRKGKKNGRRTVRRRRSAKVEESRA